MNWIPEKFSKKWLGRVLINIILLSIVFSITIGITIRGEVQMKLLAINIGLSTIVSILCTLPGFIGFKLTYLFTILGMFLGMGYLMFYHYSSANGLAGVVGFMSLFEFIGIGFIVGVIVEIVSKIKKKIF